VLTSDFDFSAHGPFAADAFVATRATKEIYQILSDD
jgi:hypothetical protein